MGILNVQEISKDRIDNLFIMYEDQFNDTVNQIENNIAIIKQIDNRFLYIDNWLNYLEFIMRYGSLFNISYMILFFIIRSNYTALLSLIYNIVLIFLIIYSIKKYNIKRKDKLVQINEKLLEFIGKYKKALGGNYEDKIEFIRYQLNK